MRGRPVIVDPAMRPMLRRLARLLLGYGIAGLVVAAIGVLALIVALGRVNGLADRLRDDVGGVSATLERTATVLDNAAATAGGFGTTVDSSTTALNQAANDLRAIVPQLRDIETRANDINVLGSRPLEPIAGLFGQIAGQLGDLDTQLDGVASNLTANRAALTANATSLADLAAQTRTLSQRLGGDSLPAAVEDARWLILAMLVVGTLGAVVPASGALLVWSWLRRWLDRSPGLLT
jgi:ABC-type transporter Mla subunit MlaD